MSGDDRTRWIQHCVNCFNDGKPVGTKRRGASLHYSHLKLDGRRGPRYKEAVKKARYHCGLGPERWEGNSTEVSDDFLRIIKDPYSGDRKRRRLGAKRRKARIKRWKDQRRPHPSTKGLVYFDGKLCAAWIARGYVKARAHGVAFVLLSGFRTAAYSILLCMRICNRPRCPGLCAGATTNHTGIEFPHGAGDSTNAPRVRQVAQWLGVPLHNHLPRDQPHSSFSGY